MTKGKTKGRRMMLLMVHVRFGSFNGVKIMVRN